jgi:hypothetical protein
LSVFLYAGVLSSGAPSTDGTTTTLTSTTSTWAADEWIGETVRIDSGTDVGESRIITDNTTDTLTWSPAFDNATSSGDTFRVARTLRVRRDSMARSLTHIGDRRRAFDGTVRSTIRSRPATYTFRTPPLTLADASSYEDTVTPSTQPVECGGDLFSSGSLQDCDADLLGSEFIEASTGPREVLEIRLMESS